MFAIIGILIVIGAVIGGYLMEHGHMAVLFQPAELVIIGGAALGTLLIGNPMHTITAIISGLMGVLKGSPYSKPFYLDNLKMLNEIFAYARKNGMTKLEADVDDPAKSQLFGRYPKLIANHHALHFICDTLRTAISGGVSHFELDQVMEADMELHHHEANEPVHALSAVADSLPGLGIVAAVLGVVITMGSIGGPPEEIGHKVGRGTRRDVSRHPALLRLPRAPRREHDEDERLRTRVLEIPESRRDGVRKRLRAHPRGRVRAAAGAWPRTAPPLKKWKRPAAAVAAAVASRCPTPKNQTIIIIKKKVAGAGHHGGAWKVAYADFVTAMMGLLHGHVADGHKRPGEEGRGRYFTNPRGDGQQLGSGMAGAGDSISVNRENMSKLKDQLQAAMKEVPDFQKLKDQVTMTVTGEGLRIELMETEKGMFFESGSPSPSSNGQEMLIQLARELGKLENNIMIEGHTDSKPINGRDGYSNWELSGDRANAARRLMQQSGLRVDQVKQVRGFADQHLMDEKAPDAASNRRVSIIVQYNTPKEDEKEDKPKKTEPKAPSPSKTHSRPRAAAVSSHPPRSSAAASSQH